MQIRNRVAHPLKVALVGCGRWGSRIATTVAALPEYELVHVCDPVVRWPGAAWAPELTDDICRNVDAVLVATPPDEHAPPALRALSHARAVFVEKPFALSAADAFSMATARGDTTLMVGHLLVFHPVYQRLLRELDAGTLGEVRRVHVVRHSPSRGASRCPWWTLAPHDLSLLVRLLGKPEFLNVKLASNARDVVAELRWGRVTAELDYSTSAPTKARSWRLETTRTAVELDENLNLWVQGGRVDQLPTEPSPLALELLHFARCVVHAELPLTGVDDALANVELLCLGQKTLSRSQVHSGYSPAQGSPL